ncbi:MAG: Sialic acid-specific 9-O-acetylesterase [Armatimonadetes bacterium]|nr:Sialic acid-specific 9-O-acetylesterase [Armatimonadota bacterium]
MSRLTLAAPALLSLFLCGASPAAAEVKLNPLFSSGMVLQRNTEVPVWGTAAKGEQVTVQIQDQTVTAVGDKDGTWKARLKNLTAGGPFQLTVKGENTVEVPNVLVGEVWVCSGQSNMAFALSGAASGSRHIAESKNPMLRLFQVGFNPSDTPVTEVKGQWVECGPDTAGKFSAVGYFFGRDLQKALGVPVGLIQSAVGGTPAEAWTSKETLAANPEFKNILNTYAEAVKNYPQAKEQYDAAVAKYREAAAAARKQGATPPRAPQQPYGPENPRRPSCLYNGMIYPLVPYAIRGAIWYQGESNASRAHEYRALYPAMIQNWRDQWQRKNFPFIGVQLAPFKKISPQPQESDWAELREAQLLATKVLPKVGMAVITDVGDQDDIHPTRKEPVGARLALQALRLAYGEKGVGSGPEYEAMEVDGGRIVLKFKNVGSGLFAQDGPLKGFTICGRDRAWTPAMAEIQADRVIVWSRNVAEPVAVRFGWADYPVVNLWNKDGLPATPFRTDDFPLTTDPANRKSAK